MNQLVLICQPDQNGNDSLIFNKLWSTIVPYSKSISKKEKIMKVVPRDGKEEELLAIINQIKDNFNLILDAINEIPDNIIFGICNYKNHKGLKVDKSRLLKKKFECLICPHYTKLKEVTWE